MQTTTTTKPLSARAQKRADARAAKLTIAPHLRGIERRERAADATIYPFANVSGRDAAYCAAIYAAVGEKPFTLADMRLAYPTGIAADICSAHGVASRSNTDAAVFGGPNKNGRLVNGGYVVNTLGANGAPTKRQLTKSGIELARHALLKAGRKLDGAKA